MGLDPHFLGALPYSVEFGNFGIWRNGILAFSVNLYHSLLFGPRLTTTRIKVLALIVFFILAIIISAGGIGPGPIGFKYYHDPGAFNDGINGVAKTFVVAGTLYAGTEM
jgi:amino acid permease